MALLLCSGEVLAQDRKGGRCSASGAVLACRLVGRLFILAVLCDYLCSDDMLGSVTLAKSGAVLFQTYRFIVERELVDGSLVEVLQPFAGR